MQRQRAANGNGRAENDVPSADRDQVSPRSVLTAWGWVTLTLWRVRCGARWSYAVHAAREGQVVGRLWRVVDPSGLELVSENWRVGGGSSRLASSAPPWVVRLFEGLTVRAWRASLPVVELSEVAA